MMSTRNITQRTTGAMLAIAVVLGAAVFSFAAVAQSVQATIITEPPNASCTAADALIQTAERLEAAADRVQATNPLAARILDAAAQQLRAQAAELCPPEENGA